MTNKKIFTSIFVFISVCCLPVTAGISGNAGVNGAQYLRIASGARPSGMAEAFTAVSDDLNAVYWNPAGLAQLNNRQFLFYHNQWLSDITEQSISYAFPMEKLGGIISGSVRYLHMGELVGTDESGNETGDFKAYNMSGALSYAAEIMKSNLYLFKGPVYAGGNVKYFREKIEKVEAQSFCADAGLLVGSTIKLGVAVQNIGPGIKYINKTEKLPFNIKTGLAYEAAEKGFIAAADVSKPSDNKFVFSFGSELELIDFLALRAGYTTGNDAGLGFSFGFSAGTDIGKHNFNLNYSFIPYGRLDNVHRISLGVRFANPPEKDREEKKDEEDSDEPESRLKGAGAGSVSDKEEEDSKTEDKVSEDKYEVKEVLNSRADIEKLKKAAEKKETAIEKKMRQQRESMLENLKKLEGVNIREEFVKMFDRETNTEKLEERTVISLGEDAVYFAFDSAELREEGKLVLDKIAGLLRAAAGYKVSIEGHTDSIGPAKYNRDLSLRRATSVRNYFVNEKKISAGRFSVRNRRVEIILKREY